MEHFHISAKDEGKL